MSDDDEIIRLCDEVLELMRRQCARDMNEDRTLWCGRNTGHTGECRPVGWTVTL